MHLMPPQAPDARADSGRAQGLPALLRRRATGMQERFAQAGTERNLQEQSLSSRPMHTHRPRGEPGPRRGRKRPRRGHQRGSRSAAPDEPPEPLHWGR